MRRRGRGHHRAVPRHRRRRPAGTRGAGRAVPDRPAPADGGPGPAWLLDYEDAYAEPDTATARLEDDLDDLLGLLPFALPSEAQWEYAARAGTTTLTFRGDGKPDEEQLLDDFADEKRTASSENAFGLAAMGSAGELCADVWIPGYAGAPTDARPRTGDGPRTARGGAADLSPWQGCDEWLLLLSATRYEHAQFTAVRPVAPLPPA
ncbi:formylglycine-generating enzyme family protein [Plantactinospora sp. DSM 117369]